LDGKMCLVGTRKTQSRAEMTRLVRGKGRGGAVLAPAGGL